MQVKGLIFRWQHFHTSVLMWASRRPSSQCSWALSPSLSPSFLSKWPVCPLRLWLETGSHPRLSLRHPSLPHTPVSYLADPCALPAGYLRHLDTSCCPGAAPPGSCLPTAAWATGPPLSPQTSPTGQPEQSALLHKTQMAPVPSSGQFSALRLLI